MQIKHIFFDLDGTLLDNSKKISKNNMDAIRRYCEKGGSFSIITGRPWKVALDYGEQVFRGAGFWPKYIGAFNGSFSKNLTDGSIILDETLSEDETLELYNFAKEMGCTFYSYYKEGFEANEVLTKKSLASFFVYLIRNVKPRYEKKYLAHRSYKVNLLHLSKNKLQKVLKKMNERFKDKFEFSQSFRFGIEVTPKNINKGAYGDKISALEKIPFSEMAAFGDSSNDLPLFQRPLMGIAMQKSHREIHEAACQTTCSNNCSGIAFGIDNFIINRQTDYFKEIKLVAIDLDGTLLNDDMTIHPETIRTVSEVVNTKTTVVIATGRSLSEAKYFFDMLHLRDYKSYLITSNGASIYDMGKESELNAVFIEKKLVNKLVDVILNANISLDEYLFIGTNEDGNCRAMGNSKTWERILPKLPPQVYEYVPKANLSVFKGTNLLKFLVFAPQIDAIKNVVEEELGNIFEIVKMSDRSIEITMKNINKATALSKLLTHLNLTSDNLMAIGDSYNDIEMLKLAKYSFAMEHADHEVKKHAKYIGPYQTSVGVGEILKKHTLQTQTGTQKLDCSAKKIKANTKTNDSKTKGTNKKTASKK